MQAQMIYIAGPLTPTTSRTATDNIFKANKIAHQIFQLGHFPYIPHLSWYFDWWLKSEHETLKQFDYEDYMHWCFGILEHSDALYYLGSSPGADRELKFAESNNIVIYRSIDEVPEVV